MAAQNNTMPSPEVFRTLLRRHHLKATRQRMAVHDVMMALGHASADMVTEELQQRGTKVTVASVYNILSQLADLRIYSRRLSANNKMYFDVCSSRHLHMYDVANHTFRDLPVDEMLDLVHERLGKKRFRGYKVEGVDIVILARPNKKQ